MKLNKLTDWLEQLFWEIGHMAILFLKGDIKGAIEMTYWIRIHLSYHGVCVSKARRPFFEVVKSKCTAGVGLIIVLGLLCLIRKFILFLNLI